jgi:membrane protease YdiL (CAAX protease family)
MGFLSWRTRSVIPSIILHGINNLVSLLVLNFELDKKMDWYLMGEHVSPVILVPALYLLVWSIRRITEISEATTIE